MYGLKDRLVGELTALAAYHDLDRLILFGSRARGDHRERSDIDLAVLGGDTARFALDADEETSTLLRFDIVDLGGAVQPELLESIRRDGKVLYAKVR
ncbi:MAG: nucleotidyltransferase domain-containing protein [Clostridia bacterium]|nr:nucleotidyltransferase domain-containing protein [Clostridia bacterium]